MNVHVKRKGDAKMPSQLFRVTRAPEAAPVDARQLQRMLWVERDDSQWSVEEMEVLPARVVSKQVAAALRKKGRSPA